MGMQITPQGNVYYTPKEYTVHQIWLILVPPMDIIYTHYALVSVLLLY